MSGTRSAIQALTAAGITATTVARELGVCPRTVTRWTGGTQPRRGNLAALRVLVDRLLAEVLAGDAICDGVQAVHLQHAVEALLTDAERARLDRLAADVAATIEAANRPYVPVTATVEPFGLCRADDLDAQLDHLFPLPAAA